VSPQCREAEHNLNKKVEVSAPGKLMLFGEHAVIYQRPCIVTAVDQRMRVSVELTDTKFFKIDAPDVGVSEYSEEFGLPATSDVPKGVRFTAAATRNFYQLHRIKSGPRAIFPMSSDLEVHRRLQLLFSKHYPICLRSAFPKKNCLS
jgi:mevalonate kinase